MDLALSVVILVNDSEAKFAFAPSHSLFGLDADKWMSCTIGIVSTDSTYAEPCEQMRGLASLYVPERYTEVPFNELVPPGGWVLREDYRKFLAIYKDRYKATMRFGQAFLFHFKDSFSEQWPELFYCEDDSKAQSLLIGKVF